MEIIFNELIDMQAYGRNSECLVHCVHIKVQNIKLHANEIIKIISDKSWISRLNAIDQVAYEACAGKTITKLISSILSKVEDKVTEEFGEYLVSHVAQDLLIKSFKHGHIPLAELFKEKLSNNMGFDFHTESSSQIIVFGEAKYSSTGSPYTNAITQIIDFINDSKDEGELLHLQKFVSSAAATNAINKKKGFVAAFSLNAINPQITLQNLLKSKHLDSLLNYPELYLIGVEVDVQVID